VARPERLDANARGKAHGVPRRQRLTAKDLRHAQRLAKTIRKENPLELLAPVELSAVCFRNRGTGGKPEEELNRFNQAALKRVTERGKVYLSNATLRGKFCLRACIVNHRTRDEDVDSIIPEVLVAAREIG
jgi:glutamate/tyrosine decarboxylase-like PLP-dependent enzyme